MSDQLFITRWQLTNIRSFASLILEPKTVTTVTGANGLGKSNILESFRILFEGGWNDAWVKEGEDEGQILCDLSDGTQIRCTLKRPNAKRKTYQRLVTITAPTGEAIKAEQTWLNTLASGIAYDPSHFLVCDEKERAKYLTSVLRVDLDRREVAEAVGEEWYAEYWDSRLAPFDQIKRIRDVAYTRRTSVNSDHKRIFGAVQTMRKEVPSLNADSAELDAAAASAATELRDAESELAAALSSCDSEASAAEHAAHIKREADRREAHEAYQRKLAEFDTEFSHSLAAIGTAKSESRQIIQDDAAPRLSAAREADAIARQHLAEYHNAVGVRKALSREEDRLKELAGEEARLTLALERLDALKRRKMDSSPIPGLELRDGKIYYEGRDFDSATNTAKRVEIAIQLAALNPGRWPGMLVDDAEHLDTATWDAFLAAAKDSGYQIIAARVTDGDLAVQTT